MKNKLRVLIVEDSEDDAELLLRELKSGGYEPLSERVDMPEALSDALKRQSWDVITCDHSMPHFDAFKVLVLLRSSGIDVPCIIVSGKIGEETAVKLMKAGANDYIMKGNLNRLAPAIEREILDKEVRHARKLAESELLIKNRAIQSSINATALSDLEGNLTYVNPSFLKMWRCNNGKEVLGKSVVEFCSEKEKASKVIVALQNHGSWTGELSSKRKDGSTFFVQLSANLVTSYDGKPVCMMASFIDITDRIKAESLLIESEEKYRSIIETSNEGILIANTENYKFKYANPAICRMLGYTQKELTAMDVTAIHPKENLQSILATFQDQVSGKYSTATDIPCLRKDGTIFYADINTTKYTINNQNYAAGFFHDTTERKEAKKTLEESHKKTIKLLEETIKTLATIVEVRDPYTAGHQKRVTQLATSIAKEMGLEQDRIDAIRTAAAIHDIGKINIAASILAKPGKISDLEYEMIKTHPKASFDMIKNIDFAQPVANIVLQHHERINGTGYPKGLCGDDIMLEAKILAVSDVVEAMASHRPYRPSLGIDAALEEIEKNKATLYDPGVVDACIEVIKQDKLKF